MYYCVWPGIPTAPGVGSDAQVFRKSEWGCGVASVARGGMRHPPQLILGYAAGIPPGIPFHIAPDRGGDTQYFHSKRQSKER